MSANSRQKRNESLLKNLPAPETEKVNKVLGVIMIQYKWVLCPICGGKTRTKIRPDTEAKNLIVFCPKCKRENLVNIKDMESCVIKNV